MIFLIDAIVLGFAAFFWSKDGALNILVVVVLAAMTVANASLASPFVTKLFGQ